MFSWIKLLCRAFKATFYNVIQWNPHKRDFNLSIIIRSLHIINVMMFNPIINEMYFSNGQSHLLPSTSSSNHHVLLNDHWLSCDFIKFHLNSVTTWELKPIYLWVLLLNEAVTNIFPTYSACSILLNNCLSAYYLSSNVT